MSGSKAYYLPFDHGYHHERTLIDLSPRIRFLLGMCFCQHCTDAAVDNGIDVSRLAGWAREEIREAFEREDYDEAGLIDRLGVPRSAGRTGGLPGCAQNDGRLAR